MGAINALLDESVAADGFAIREGSGNGAHAVIDISAIDFQALAKRFAASKQQRVELERLRAAIRAQLERMVEVNRSRADYLARFEELIESYNAGSRNIEELFLELVALSQALSEEQQRHVREQLTEDELTVFDVLTRPGPDLSPAERDEVKRVACALLDKVRGAVMLGWRERVQGRAQVRLAIEDTLDDGLPRAYTPELYESKVAAVFEHVFERYPDAASVRPTRVA